MSKYIPTTCQNTCSVSFEIIPKFNPKNNFKIFSSSANLGTFFTAIEHLTIHNSKLKYLHRFCFTSISVHLVYLDLHHNEIESIPSDTFDDLRLLVFLQLTGNKLTSLNEPSFLSQLHNLHTFAANSNKITDIDENFLPLGVRWIYLAGNKIQRLLVDFRRFEKLRAVDLRGNAGSCNFLFNYHEGDGDDKSLEVFQVDVVEKMCRLL
jgi:Leucine-rich repeat (LRR) protein